MLANPRHNLNFVPSKVLLLANFLLHVTASFSLYLSALPLLFSLLLTVLLGIHFLTDYYRWSQNMFLEFVNEHYILRRGDDSALVINIYYESAYVIIFRCQCRGRLRYYPVVYDMCSKEAFHYLRLYSKAYL